MADLYIDAARLGLMSPAARRLNAAFARLASQPDGLLYFADFFRGGYDAWPDQLRRRYPDLRRWQGVAGLGAAVKRLVGAGPHADVLLASRSASLLRLAACTVADRYGELVTVDLLWPPYRRILADVCRQTGARLSVIRLRRHVLRGSAPWLATLIAAHGRRTGGYGIFLPAITHRGVELPVGPIVKSLRAASPGVHVVVDAAQAAGHVPLDFNAIGCDVLIAGCHKWLGGCHPLGFAVTADATMLRQAGRLIRRRTIEDPLMQLCCELGGDSPVRYGETACLAPLMAGQGAIHDALRKNARDELAGRLRNRRRVVRLLLRRRWRTASSSATTRHGVCVAKPPIPSRGMAPSALRRCFQRFRIAATVYNDLSVRLALPSALMPETALAQLDGALQWINDEVDGAFEDAVVA